MHRSLIILTLAVFLCLTGCSPVVVGHANVLARERESDLPEPAGPSLPSTPVRRPPTVAITLASTKEPTLVSIQPEAAAGFSPSATGLYCLWPGDNLTAIARAAQVSLTEIEMLNPSASQYAGSAIRLPLESVPPEHWGLPAPSVSGPDDLPFGVSGYYLGADNRHKRVALTFDIGYVPENKERMVWLREKGISATFFVMGISISRHPDVVTDILSNGHALGNHSWDHPNFQKLDPYQMQTELEKTEKSVQAADASATTKPYFRAPFGAIDARVEALTRQLGYHIIGWTVDSGDWEEGITSEQVYQRVIRHACPGAIIVMHDANPANMDALPRIVDYLQTNGYEIVPLKDLLGF